MFGWEILEETLTLKKASNMKPVRTLSGIGGKFVLVYSVKVRHCINFLMSLLCFSVDEMASHALPTMIKFVLNETKQDNLS